MPEVRCKVNSCVFWGEGDHCTAHEIWVKDGSEEEDLFHLGDFEFAEELEGEGRQAGASTSSQTFCETMRPRVEGGGGKGCCR